MTGYSQGADGIAFQDIRWSRLKPPAEMFAIALERVSPSCARGPMVTVTSAFLVSSPAARAERFSFFAGGGQIVPPTIGRELRWRNVLGDLKGGRLPGEAWSPQVTGKYILLHDDDELTFISNGVVEQSVTAWGRGRGYRIK